MKGILKALLLPIGRNLLDIDIFGIDNYDSKVFAQVPYSNQQSEVARKLQLLKHYKGHNPRLVFFGPAACEILDPEVNYIPVEKVFGDLQSSQETVYRQVIDKMFQ
ncbi:MAG TPA: hypothetical protein PKM21_07375 [Anaerolineales bacterium]|nr:hypothetical protein [Anaerolineales bacterium]